MTATSTGSTTDEEVAAERGMIRSIIRTTILVTPLAVAVVLGMMALAMGNDQPWYIWIGFGVGFGIYGALLVGVLGAVTVAAHHLDEGPRHP
jgi:hypothetical protein